MIGLWGSVLQLIKWMCLCTDYIITISAQQPSVPQYSKLALILLDKMACFCSSKTCDSIFNHIANIFNSIHLLIQRFFSLSFFLYRIPYCDNDRIHTRTHCMHRRKHLGDRSWSIGHGFGKWNIKSSKTCNTQPSSESRTENRLCIKCWYATGYWATNRKWCCICWWQRRKLFGDCILHRIQIHIPLFEHWLWYFRWSKLRERSIQALHKHQSSNNGSNRRSILRLCFANVWLAGEYFVGITN